jgi:hypothetical protein
MAAGTGTGPMIITASAITGKADDSTFSGRGGGGRGGSSSAGSDDRWLRRT